MVNRAGHRDKASKNGIVKKKTARMATRTKSVRVADLENPSLLQDSGTSSLLLPTTRIGGLWAKINRCTVANMLIW